MMDTAALKIIYLVGFVLSVLIRWPHGKRNKQNHIVESRKTPLEIALLLFTSAGMLIVPLVYALTPLLDSFSYQLPVWANVAGIVLFAGALFLFWRTHRDLGRNWSATLELRDGHILVMEGIYKYVRHPLST
jgi:protein-S-isoprenylcysteine O-methyltransferase Ste14